MLIGTLAAESGFSRDTIRYYEKRGLLPSNELGRHENNYKDYSPKIVERLAQISQLKSLGFSLTEIKSLLSSFDANDLSCSDLPRKLKDKIAMFDKKIELLKQYKSQLEIIDQACDSECGDGSGFPECFHAVESLNRDD